MKLRSIFMLFSIFNFLQFFHQISLAVVFEDKNLSVFRSLRTLRALRPLRAISRLEGMRVIIFHFFVFRPYYFRHYLRGLQTIFYF